MAKSAFTGLTEWLNGTQRRFLVLSPVAPLSRPATLPRATSRGMGWKSGRGMAPRATKGIPFAAAP
jgi:hypothetical protein